MVCVFSQLWKLRISKSVIIISKSVASLSAGRRTGLVRSISGPPATLPPAPPAAPAQVLSLHCPRPVPRAALLGSYTCSYTGGTELPAHSGNHVVDAARCSVFLISTVPANAFHLFSVNLLWLSKPRAPSAFLVLNKWPRFLLPENGHHCVWFCSTFCRPRCTLFQNFI